jgi:hypothetical protein
LLRATGSTVALVAIYYLLPLDHSSTPAALTTLVIGLVVFIGLLGFQVRSIIRSQFPGLRAIEALATSVPQGAWGRWPGHAGPIAWLARQRKRASAARLYAAVIVIFRH